MTEQNMYDSTIIAKNIKKQAKCKGITIKELMINCQLGINTVSKLAHGNDIYSKNLAKIADYLECSVDYLLGRTDNPNIHFIDGSSIKNNPKLMKMYKLLPVYPSTNHVIERVRFLSIAKIKDVVVRRNENTEKADFIVAFQSSRMEPIYHEGDFLLIEKTDHINTGEIGIFVIDKVQAFVVKKDNDYLTFADHYFPPIQIDSNVYCVGRVIGTIDLHYSKDRWIN